MPATLLRHPDIHTAPAVGNGGRAPVTEYPTPLTPTSAMRLTHLDSSGSVGGVESRMRSMTTYPRTFTFHFGQLSLLKFGQFSHMPNSYPQTKATSSDM